MCPICDGMSHTELEALAEEGINPLMEAAEADMDVADKEREAEGAAREAEEETGAEEVLLATESADAPEAAIFAAAKRLVEGISA